MHIKWNICPQRVAFAVKYLHHNSYYESEIRIMEENSRPGYHVIPTLKGHCDDEEEML